LIKHFQLNASEFHCSSNKQNVSVFFSFSSEFLRSLKCLEKYEDKLVLSAIDERCSKEKAYYYFYGDLIMRLQLSINICESF